MVLLDFRTRDCKSEKMLFHNFYNRLHQSMNGHQSQVKNTSVIINDTKMSLGFHSCHLFLYLTVSLLFFLKNKK